MLHRIRLAVRESGFNKLGGDGAEVEADETFVGGKTTNMHRHSKRKAQAHREGNWGKTVVLGLLERDGDVRAAVAPTRRNYDVHKHVLGNLAPGSTLYTDEHTAYESLPQEFAHEVINKLEGYVKGKIHVNGMENFLESARQDL